MMKAYLGRSKVSEVSLFQGCPLRGIPPYAAIASKLELIVIFPSNCRLSGCIRILMERFSPLHRTGLSKVVQSEPC